MSIQHISALSSFIKQIERLPYIPSKYTLRFVNYFLEMSPEAIDDFFKSLIILRNALVLCDICCSWREINNECLWCSKKRNQEKICVVETWIDAGSLEKSGIFDGMYHVLGGVINPLEGKTPDHLS